MKILSLIAQYRSNHVGPLLIKLRYLLLNLKAFWPSTDSMGTTTVKAQKHSKDIVKIVHVTSVDQL